MAFQGFPPQGCPLIKYHNFVIFIRQKNVLRLLVKSCVMELFQHCVQSCRCQVLAEFSHVRFVRIQASILVSFETKYFMRISAHKAKWLVKSPWENLIKYLRKSIRFKASSLGTSGELICSYIILSKNPRSRSLISLTYFSTWTLVPFLTS